MQSLPFAPVAVTQTPHIPEPLDIEAQVAPAQTPRPSLSHLQRIDQASIIGREAFFSAMSAPFSLPGLTPQRSYQVQLIGMGTSAVAAAGSALVGVQFGVLDNSSNSDLSDVQRGFLSAAFVASSVAVGAAVIPAISIFTQALQSTAAGVQAAAQQYANPTYDQAEFDARHVAVNSTRSPVEVTLAFLEFESLPTSDRQVPPGDQCPISFNELGAAHDGIAQPVVIEGQPGVFEYQDLQQALTAQQTNPLSRAPVELAQIQRLPTSQCFS